MSTSLTSSLSLGSDDCPDVDVEAQSSDSSLDSLTSLSPDSLESLELEEEDVIAGGSLEPPLDGGISRGFEAVISSVIISPNARYTYRRVACICGPCLLIKSG